MPYFLRWFSGGRGHPILAAEKKEREKASPPPLLRKERRREVDSTKHKGGEGRGGALSLPPRSLVARKRNRAIFNPCMSLLLRARSLTLKMGSTLLASVSLRVAVIFLSLFRRCTLPKEKKNFFIGMQVLILNVPNESISHH